MISGLDWRRGFQRGRSDVLDGLGIGDSPTWRFAPELRRGQVVALMTHWQAPKLPIHRVSPPAHRGSAKVGMSGDFVAAGLHRGSQYCARSFQAALASYGMQSPMRSKGNCRGGNAPTESVWSSPKV